MEKKYAKDYSDELNSFLEWTVNSAGSWILIDPYECILITSPGWPGGYIDFETLALSTEVRPVLSSRHKRNKQLIHSPAARRYLSPKNPNGTYSFPLQSPFRGIQMLGGGYLVNYKEGNIVSYLRKASSGTVDGSSSFEEAMIETASRCAHPTTLMFSGGKDSLALYLALKSAAPSDDIRVVYVDQDGLVSGGRLDQAKRVASHCRVLPNVVEPEGGWAFGDSSTWQDLHSLLAETLVNPCQPYHAVSQEPDRLFIDGQNMDAMLSIDMPKPPQYFRPVADIEWWAKHIASYVPKSIRYTNLFLRSAIFEWFVLKAERGVKRALSAIGKAEIAETPKIRDTSFRGILKSLMSGELPGSAKYDHASYRESEKIERIVSRRDFQEAWFNLYPKMTSILQRAGNTVHHFVDQGTMYRVWKNNISVKDSVRTKKCLSKFIADKSGVNFDKIMNEEKCNRKVQGQKNVNLEVLRKYKYMFDISSSALCQLADKDLREWLSGEIPRLKSKIFNPLLRSQEGDHNNIIPSRAFRYINL